VVEKPCCWPYFNPGKDLLSKYACNPRVAAVGKNAHGKEQHHQKLPPLIRPLRIWIAATSCVPPTSKLDFISQNTEQYLECYMFVL
jgi:hypothetical protein